MDLFDLDESAANVQIHITFQCSRNDIAFNVISIECGWISQGCYSLMKIIETLLENKIPKLKRKHFQHIDACYSKLCLRIRVEFDSEYLLIKQNSVENGFWILPLNYFDGNVLNWLRRMNKLSERWWTAVLWQIGPKVFVAWWISTLLIHVILITRT